MTDTLIMQDILHTPESLSDTLAEIGATADYLAESLLAHGTRRLMAVGSGTAYYASAASAYLTIAWSHAQAPWC